jgi:hypothetical protein
MVIGKEWVVVHSTPLTQYYIHYLFQGHVIHTNYFAMSSNFIPDDKDFQVPPPTFLQVGGRDKESIAIRRMSWVHSSSVLNALQPTHGSIADLSLLASSDINHKQQDFLRHCKIHVFWDVTCRTSRRFEGLILRYVGKYSHNKPASSLSGPKSSTTPLSEPPPRTTVHINGQNRKPT